MPVEGRSLGLFPFGPFDHDLDWSAVAASILVALRLGPLHLGLSPPDKRSCIAVFRFVEQAIGNLGGRLGAA